MLDLDSKSHLTINPYTPPQTDCQSRLPTLKVKAGIKGWLLVLAIFWGLAALFYFIISVIYIRAGYYLYSQSEQLEMGFKQVFITEGFYLIVILISLVLTIIRLIMLVKKKFSFPSLTIKITWTIFLLKLLVYVNRIYQLDLTLHDLPLNLGLILSLYMVWAILITIYLQRSARVKATFTQ